MVPMVIGMPMASGASCDGLACSSSSAFSPATGSRSVFFSGSSQLQVNRGEAKIVCRKPEIHPTFYDQAKVYCKGEHVMTTGGTLPEYVVDIWSGNHPFFQGEKSGVLLDTDQVEKFRKKYGSLGLMNKIPVITKSVPKFDKKKKQDKAAKKGKK